MPTLFAATPEKVVREALEFTGVGIGAVVYDVGAGDGRIAIESALLGAEAFAIEIDPICHGLILENAIKANASIKGMLCDAKEVEYRGATHIFYTLRDEPEIERKIIQETDPTAKVITFGLDFRGLKKTEEKQVNIQGSVYDLSLSMRNFEDIKKLYALTVQELVEKMPTRLRYFWAGPQWYSVWVFRKETDGKEE